MNRKSIAQACFIETCVVPPRQIVRSLVTHFPDGPAPPDALIEHIAADHLVAVVESICIKEMQRHIDPAVEVVIGRSMRLEHCGVTAGAAILVMGWCEQLGRRCATFCVHVFDDHALVCEGQVSLWVPNRRSINSNIATRSARL